MCILVYLAPSWTDLKQFVTEYPVLFSMLHFKFLIITTFIQSYTYNVKAEHPYLTLLIIIQYCIHLSYLHKYFGVAIFTGHLHLHNFTL